MGKGLGVNGCLEEDRVEKGMRMGIWKGMGMEKLMRMGMEKQMDIWEVMRMEKGMRMEMHKENGDSELNVEGGEGARDSGWVLIPPCPPPGAARPVPPAAVAFHAAHLPGLGRRDGVQPRRGQVLGWHPPPTQGVPWAPPPCPAQREGGTPAPRKARGGSESPMLPVQPIARGLIQPPVGWGAQNCHTRTTTPPPKF